MDIPALVGEDPIEAYKGRAATLIAPCKCPVLERDFLEATVIQNSPKSPHETQVEVLVVFVPRTVDEVEVTQNDSFGIIVWLDGAQMIEEKFFLRIARWAVDCDSLYVDLHWLIVTSTVIEYLPIVAFWISTVESFHNSSMPPLVQQAGLYMNLLSLYAPRKFARDESMLRSFVSCRQAIWHGVVLIVSCTASRQRAAALSPRTFHEIMSTFLHVICNLHSAHCPAARAKNRKTMQPEPSHCM